jgi:Raf kinase inhibitor-like YbhB/YbcL family protein
MKARAHVASTLATMGSVLASALALAGCGAGGGGALAAGGAAIQSMAVTSRSFSSGGQIPVDYTCDGADHSPQLTWSAPPAGTQSFAILMEDPDAPSGTFTHWLALDISGDTRTIADAIDVATVGGRVGTNDFKRPGYSGPCPPRLEIHRYAFRVFALDAPLKSGPEPTRDAFDAALRGHVLGAGVLVGEFSH